MQTTTMVFTKEELLTSLIRNDLIHLSLLEGFRDLSFETSHHNMYLEDAMHYILGIHHPDLCSSFSELYQKRAEKAIPAKAGVFADVYRGAAERITRELVKKADSMTTKRMQRNLQLREREGMTAPGRWNNEQLLLALIKNDLIHRRILYGLSRLGFDVKRFELDLDACVISFLGVWKIEQIHEYKREYFRIAEEAQNFKFQPGNMEFINLTQRIYSHLQAMYVRDFFDMGDN